MRCLTILLACGWLLISDSGRGRILTAHETKKECEDTQTSESLSLWKALDQFRAKGESTKGSTWEALYRDYQWAACFPSDISPQLLKRRN
jgi:hypothetical protein